MIFLVCDIGNSYTKIGLYSGNTLKFKKSVSNQDISKSTFQNIKFDRAAISSVAPGVTDKLLNIFAGLDEIPLLINRELKLDFIIDYETPETLGIDRICGVAGTLSLLESGEIPFHKNLIFADFGTATTINVTKNKSFQGGIILPGIRTMINSLNRNTAQLPEISEKDYQELIGKSTKSSIASGVFNSTTGLIEKVYTNVYKNDNNPAPLIITGGNAEVMKKFLTVPLLHIDDLVLRGIRKILETNL